MIKEIFNIYIERLKEGDIEQILETVDPSFLEIKEEDLFFTDKVKISGQVYLANNHIILDLKLRAIVCIPCSICNEKIKIPILIEDFTHTEEISGIKSGIWNYSEELRSALLLKVPQFIECEGNCPYRKDLNQYLKKSQPEAYTPFSELSL